MDRFAALEKTNPEFSHSLGRSGKSGLSIRKYDFQMPLISAACVVEMSVHPSAEVVPVQNRVFWTGTSYGHYMKRADSVDDYIAQAENWQAELAQLRKVLCATALTEEIKWGAPCYTYKGKNVVGLGAYKAYVGLWFHQGALLTDKNQVLINAQQGKTRALRQWRMKSTDNIRPLLIRRYVKEAIQLVEDGKQIAPLRARKLLMPPALERALQKSKSVAKKFAALTPGRQREYADYVSEAKREATKQARVDKILPLIVAGGGLHDRYRR